MKNNELLKNIFIIRMKEYLDFFKSRMNCKLGYTFVNCYFKGMIGE